MAGVSRFLFISILALSTGTVAAFSTAAVADSYSYVPNSGNSTQTPQQAEAALRANAMTRTQNAILDPQQRAKLVNQNPQSQAADQSVQNLAGPAHTDDVYKLAMDVFNNIYASCNGDPVKMKAAMEQFKRDPASFANSWTPEQKAKLKEIAAKLNQTSVPGK